MYILRPFPSRSLDIVRQGIRPCVDCGMVTDHTPAVVPAPIKANASIESVVPKMSGQGREGLLNVSNLFEDTLKTDFSVATKSGR